MIFDPLLDLFRGKAVTIPPMDGALQPNTALEEAEAIVRPAAPDNLCSDGEPGFLLQRIPGLRACGHDRQCAEAGRRIRHGGHRLGGHRRRAIWRSALDDGRISGRQARPSPAPGGLTCPTALAFGDAGLPLCLPGLGGTSRLRLGRRPHGKEGDGLGLAHRSRQRQGRLFGRRSRLPLWRHRGRRWQRRDRLRKLAAPAGAAARCRRARRCRSCRSSRAIRRAWRRRPMAAPG